IRPWAAGDYRALVGTHRCACSGHDGAYAGLTRPAFPTPPSPLDPFSAAGSTGHHAHQSGRPQPGSLDRTASQQTAHSKLVVFPQFGVDSATNDATASGTI